MTGTFLAGSRKIDIDYAKAEEIKNTFGIPLDSEDFTAKTGLPAAEVLAMIRPSLEKIGAEILRTFEYYRTETGDEVQFKTMFLSGGGSMTKGLAEYLAQELSMEVKPIDIEIGSKRKDFAINSAYLKAATGAVLAGQCLLSLLPEQYKSPFRVFAKKYLNQYTCSAGFVAVLAAVFLSCWAYSISVERTYARTLEKYRGMGLEKLTVSPEGPYAGYNMPGVSDKVVLIIKELEMLTPENIRYQKMTYNRQSKCVQVSGIALDSKKSDFADYIKVLKGSPVFGSVDLIYFRDASVGRKSANEFELMTTLER
jgi:hypothetical protein